jgi:hypothetical protein
MSQSEPIEQTTDQQIKAMADVFVNFALQHGIPLPEDEEGLRQFQMALFASEEWKTAQIGGDAPLHNSGSGDIFANVPAVNERISNAKKRLKEKASSSEGDSLHVISVEMPDAFEAPQQLELFVLETLDFSLKDEIEGMTLPIFAIDRKAQTDTAYTWIKHDGKVKMRVDTPAGRPTQHDKDLVIFVVSALMNEYNAKGAIPDVIELHTRQYLIGTERKDGGTQYKQFEQTLNRIYYMTVVVETDRDDGTREISKELAYFKKTEVVTRTSTGEVMSVRLHISDWLKQQLSNKNVLTMNRDYFFLTGPLERRIYEIARKHCGRQGIWRVSLPVLHNLTGSATTLKDFKQKVKKLAETDVVPDYRLAFDGKGLMELMVVITDKDPKNLAKAIAKRVGI